MTPSPLPTLETARLLLRPLVIEDAIQAQALFPCWEIVRFMDAIVPWPYPADGARTFYETVALPAMERGEAWHWTIRLRTSPDTLVGAINLKRGDRENRGFWVAPGWQRRGIATEACAAVNDFWFDVLGFTVLRVGKAVANEASRRISAREGMRLVGTEVRDFVSGRQPGEIWEISAEEWRSRRARRATREHGGSDMTAERTAIAQRCLDAAYDGTMDFPSFVRALMEAGFEGYDVDYRRGTSTYFHTSGESVQLDLPASDTPVAAAFHADTIARAVREAQAQAPGYTYAGFCTKVKAAGCAGYMVSFPGRRVLYFGRTAETHVEHFPR